MSERKLYYRVYQDRNCMNYSFYVDTIDGVINSLEQWKTDAADSDEVLLPVVEPVLMTDEEFANLPEFTGY